MKKILLTSIIFTLVAITQAQPNLMNYQGVARNAVGNVLPSQNISLKLSILDNTVNGPVVYSETRKVTTNTFGLFNVVVGSAGALNVTGTIAGVNWAAGDKFLQVEIDPAGGSNFINAGTTQLVSVPYAIRAGAAAPLGAAGGDLTGNYPNPVIGPLKITTDKIADKAVTAAKIADGVINVQNLEFPLEKAMGINGLPLIKMTNLSDEFNSTGIEGVSTSSQSGIGVKGVSTNGGYGVFGESMGIGGAGVFGIATESVGVTGISVNSTGIYGESDNFYGVWGIGKTDGILGESNSGNGVRGKSTNGVGVVAQSINGDAIVADGSNYGVWAKGVNTGIRGESTGGTGIYGVSEFSSGVQGSSNIGSGVFGISSSSFGVWGSGKQGGVIGISTDGHGIQGQSTTGNSVYGVKLGNATGSSGKFENLNANNPANTLLAITNGNNFAIDASNTNANPTVGGGIKTSTQQGAGGVALNVANGNIQFSETVGYVNNSKVDDADLVITVPGNYTIPVGVDGQRIWVINNTAVDIIITNTTVGNYVIGSKKAKNFIRRTSVNPNNWIPVE